VHEAKCVARIRPPAKAGREKLWCAASEPNRGDRAAVNPDIKRMAFLESNVAHRKRRAASQRAAAAGMEMADGFRCAL
jgi:hypothetical protein